jgi:hypothetical protein
VVSATNESQTSLQTLGHNNARKKASLSDDENEKQRNGSDSEGEEETRRKQKSVKHKNPSLISKRSFRSESELAKKHSSNTDNTLLIEAHNKELLSNGFERLHNGIIMNKSTNVKNKDTIAMPPVQPINKLNKTHKSVSSLYNHSALGELRVVDTNSVQFQQRFNSLHSPNNAQKNTKW